MEYLPWIGLGLIALWLIGKIILKLTKWALTLALIAGIAILILYGLNHFGIVTL
jgi:hypothetical protein